MRMHLPPAGAIAKTLHRGDVGFREAQHLRRAAVVFDEAAVLAPPAAATHPRPDLVSAVTAAAIAVRLAAVGERVGQVARAANLLTADAPPTSPALDASDAL